MIKTEDKTFRLYPDDSIVNRNRRIGQVYAGDIVVYPEPFPYYVTYTNTVRCIKIANKYVRSLGIVEFTHDGYVEDTVTINSRTPIFVKEVPIIQPENVHRTSLDEVYEYTYSGYTGTEVIITCSNSLQNHVPGTAQQGPSYGEKVYGGYTTRGIGSRTAGVSNGGCLIKVKREYSYSITASGVTPSVSNKIYHSQDGNTCYEYYGNYSGKYSNCGEMVTYRADQDSHGFRLAYNYRDASGSFPRGCYILCTLLDSRSDYTPFRYSPMCYYNEADRQSEIVEVMYQQTIFNGHKHCYGTWQDVGSSSIDRYSHDDITSHVTIIGNNNPTFATMRDYVQYFYPDV